MIGIKVLFLRHEASLHLAPGAEAWPYRDNEVGRRPARIKSRGVAEDEVGDAGLGAYCITTMTATRRFADLYVVPLGKYLDGIDTISTRLNASMWFLVVSLSTVASLSRSFLPIF
jgi:hypothetical protein